MDSSRAASNADLLLRGLKDNGFSPMDSSALSEELTEFFKTCRQMISKRPYIGSGEVYRNINLFCSENGIQRITSGAIDHDVVKKNLSGEHDIYFVMTTGSSFIDKYSKEFLQEQIARGTNIYMILPNCKSDFCRDLAFIESPENSQNNLDRLTSEFDMVVKKLKFVIEEAGKIASRPETIGRVYLCAAYTLLRQTICLGKDDAGGCWGWITTTMPPVRAVGNTPSIIFEGNLSEKHFLGSSVYLHISQMIETARKRKGLVDLALDPSFAEFNNDLVVDLGERREIENAWEEKNCHAQKFMEKRRHLSEYVLIEIAAQHPLLGDRPGMEFSARLDYGFKLFQRLVSSGTKVMIYVPGSIHTKDGVVDLVSLSEAGRRYLLDLGVPEQCILGDEENREYMGSCGVYNSCDECFVSASIFNDSGFGELHCVCSPNQAMRKQLFYLNFHVIPVIHTVACETMYHHFTEELFHSIPTVLYEYPNWSEPDCPMFHLSRKERMPGYQG